MSVRTRRSLGALTLTVVALASVAAAPIPPVTQPAPGPLSGPRDDTQHPRRSRTVHVTGLLRLTDAAAGTYDATGDLTGTWTIPPSRAEDYHSSKTALIQKGVESFDGCLASPKRCGTLNSEYISWTYLRTDGRLVSGGCVHAPTGGTEGFRGVRGLLLMTDTPVGKEVNTVYQGEVILDAAPREGAEPVPGPGAASGAISAATTGVGTPDESC